MIQLFTRKLLVDNLNVKGPREPLWATGDKPAAQNLEPRARRGGRRRRVRHAEPSTMAPARTASLGLSPGANAIEDFQRAVDAGASAGL